MARNITNTAQVAVGANSVGSVTDVKYVSPPRSEITTNGLGEDVPNIVSLSARGVYKLTVSVEIDKADTNGQVALDVVYGTKASLTINYYPEGNTTGNKKYVGTAYVTDIPDSGGQGRDKVKSGDYIIVFDGAPVISTI